MIKLYVRADRLDKAITLGMKGLAIHSHSPELYFAYGRVCVLHSVEVTNANRRFEFLEATQSALAAATASGVSRDEAEELVAALYERLYPPDPANG